MLDRPITITPQQHLYSTLHLKHFPKSYRLRSCSAWLPTSPWLPFSSSSVTKKKLWYFGCGHKRRNPGGAERGGSLHRVWAPALLAGEPQVDGSGSLPMNNTLMSSLPIRDKLTYVQEVIRKSGLGESRDETEGEEGVRIRLWTPAGCLWHFNLAVLKDCNHLTVMVNHECSPSTVSWRGSVFM